VADLLACLDYPERQARTVHIAGTKGKGSTAAMVASALTAASYRTGLYTSPHLVDIRERMRVDGKLISREEFVRLLEMLKPHVAAVNTRAAYGQLTTFEVLTALGFLFFAEKGTDFQVVEVGLGGRLDATNVVRPDVSVITRISLDHTEVLGDTLSQIAAEKAGIIKPGIPVVSAPQDEEVLAVIRRACQEKSCPLVEVGQDITYRGLGINDDKQGVDIRGKLGSYTIDLPLLGNFQLENAAAAVGALEVLAQENYRVRAQDIVNGLDSVRWPGRFQILRHRPLLVVDGAHNPASACALRGLIDTYPGNETRRKILIIGTSNDKNYIGMAQELGPLFATVVVTRSRHARALDPATLAAEFQHFSEVQTALTVPEALELALSLAGKDSFIVATGSLFVVGEALEWAHKKSY
jgi:dihydrofolate synthase / folylpolyglutamate synthase